MKEFIIKYKDKSLILGKQTLIMGVINCTPDSFSGDGIYEDSEKAVEKALGMIEEGAHIIDIGGESTRPGSEFIPEEEELKRVIPVVRKLREKSDTWISIDTSKAKVAEEAIKAGADMINDISGLKFDSKMSDVAVSYHVPVIVMHIKGKPKNMQENPEYKDVIREINRFFSERITDLTEKGVALENIIVDPGIGFGKTLQQNLYILQNLSYFSSIGRPILIGTSRKSFIGKILKSDTDKRLDGTIASVALSIANGAHIVRVHDVRQISSAVKVTDAIVNCEVN